MSCSQFQYLIIKLILQLCKPSQRTQLITQLNSLFSLGQTITPRNTYLIANFRCIPSVTSLFRLPGRTRTLIKAQPRVGGQHFVFASSQKSITFSNLYPFGSSGGKTNGEVESAPPTNPINVGNSQDQNIVKEGTRFINKVVQYSYFLSQEGRRGAAKGRKDPVEQMDPYFIEAGTTAEEISSSLGEVAHKLNRMLEQTEQLYQKWCHEKEEALASKYKARHDEFRRLLTRLEEQYHRSQPISEDSPIEAALYFLDLETELTSLVELLYGAIQESSPYFKFKSDITNDDPFSKNFSYTWEKVRLIELDPATKAKHDAVYNLLRKAVIMVTSAVVTEHSSQWSNAYWRKILFGLSFPVSLINLQKAQLKCYRLWRKPKIGMIKNLLDIPEKGYIQHAKKVIYPKIRSNFFLYTPTAGAAQDCNQISDSKASNIFEKRENSNRILLLSPSDLTFKHSKPTSKLPLMKNIPGFRSAGSYDEGKLIESIIIHIHGGGFISMSSELMQNHTRPWANELKIPVFSLDYRKPPTHRFPEPLQDCVAGYKFIVENIHHHMNIHPRNIILAGDSAGGNMACALQAQLMKQKYPILPKALFLMYPAVDLRKRYTASRLNSFSDGIFLPSLLMLCQEQYLGQNKENQFHPLASPVLLKESFISPEKQGTPAGEKWPQKWPKTVIMSGMKDPLFDDSIRLLQRLAKDRIDCKMLAYKDFSHGFMSMDQVLPGAKDALKESISELRKIIQQF